MSKVKTSRGRGQDDDVDPTGKKGKGKDGKGKGGKGTGKDSASKHGMEEYGEVYVGSVTSASIRMLGKPSKPLQSLRVTRPLLQGVPRNLW